MTLSSARAPRRSSPSAGGRGVAVYLGLLVPAAALLVGGRYVWLPLMSIVPYLIREVAFPHQFHEAGGERRQWHVRSLYLILVIGWLSIEMLRAPQAPLFRGLHLWLLVLIAVLARRYFSAVSSPVAVLRAVEDVMATAAVLYLGYLLPHLVEGGSRAWVYARDSSLLVNPNTLSLCLTVAAAIPLRSVLAREADAATWLRLTVLLAAIGATYSRSAYLAVAVMLLVGAMRSVRGRALAAGLLVGLILWSPASVRDRIGYTFTDGGLDASSVTRLDLWSIAWPAALDHPLWGVGLLNLSQYFRSHGVQEGYEFAHNSFLTVVAAFGLLVPSIVVATLLARRFHRWLPRGRSATRHSTRESADSTRLPSEIALAASAVVVASIFGEPLLSPVVFIPLIAIASSRRTPCVASQDPAGVWTDGRRDLVHRSGHRAVQARPPR